MSLSDIGKLLLGLGIVLVIIGILLLVSNHIPFLKNLGRLPGDIAVEKEGFKFYFPLTTSILISILLSFILWFFRR